MPVIKHTYATSTKLTKHLSVIFVALFRTQVLRFLLRIICVLFCCKTHRSVVLALVSFVLVTLFRTLAKAPFKPSNFSLSESNAIEES